MFASLIWIHALIILSLLSFVASANQPTKEFILDTDLFDAIDDTAALLLASTLPNTKLLAVNVNVNSTYSALAASAIVNYYGYSSIPIGLRRPYTNVTSSEPFGKEYASRVAARWSGGSVPWFEVNKTLDPVELYRRTLGEAKNGSINIVSLGFMGSLSGLLNSTADKYSPLDGYGLVKAKVKELVVMGGGYLAGQSLDQEYNFAVQEASHVVNTWPSLVPMTFIGAELGVQVLTGARLTTCSPSGDPVRTSFEWWGGANVSQYSWDHLAMAYAGRGLGNWFEYANANGYNYVYPNGTNIWVDDERITNQHYLKLKASNETVAKGLEDLLLRGAWANVQVD